MPKRPLRSGSSDAQSSRRRWLCSSTCRLSTSLSRRASAAASLLLRTRPEMAPSRCPTDSPNCCNTLLPFSPPNAPAEAPAASCCSTSTRIARTSVRTEAWRSARSSAVACACSAPRLCSSSRALRNSVCMVFCATSTSTRASSCTRAFMESFCTRMASSKASSLARMCTSKVSMRMPRHSAVIVEVIAEEPPVPEGFTFAEALAVPAGAAAASRLAGGRTSGPWPLAGDTVPEAIGLSGLPSSSDSSARDARRLPDASCTSDF
mmetsp:Transcript_173287/g.555796  ORF Transcript_173287/g.555796 Transcript_173287/m.555796 type:complete len:264 (+) Transcript_173287:448-1239(+)